MTVSIAGRDIQPAVGTDYDVAQATESVVEEPLGPDDTARVSWVESHSMEVRAAQGRDKEVVPKSGDGNPIIEGGTARGDWL
jgi:hypothetical protein